MLASLQTSNDCAIVHVAQPPRWISKLPRIAFILVAPFKLVFGAVSLFWTLVVQLPTFPQVMLVQVRFYCDLASAQNLTAEGQTPPALPTLPIVQLVTRIQASKLVIDWHNTSFSILAMRLGASSPLTRLAGRLEALSGRTAFAHLFVTRAMRDKLYLDWFLSGLKLVVRDRPQCAPPKARLPAVEAHSLFSRLSVLRDPALAVLAPYEGDYTSRTLFTSNTSASTAEWRRDRPALLVSSTSWTTDEDFSILLDALDAYEAAVEAKGLRKLAVLITGKGQGRETFVRSVREKEKTWKYVRCRTVWLEMEDYPKLLEAADLGLSLHTSSSGLDLPMKVVDMFGAGLPVLALDFACIHELVQDGVNGLVFRNAMHLSDQLQKAFISQQETLADHASGQDLERWRLGVQAMGEPLWRAHWQETVLAVLQQIGSSEQRKSQ